MFIVNDLLLLFLFVFFFKIVCPCPLQLPYAIIIIVVVILIVIAIFIDFFFSIVIKSHQTSVLDARVQFAHSDSYTAPSAVACFPLCGIRAFTTTAGATRRGNSGATHHGSTVATVLTLTLTMMMSARLSRPWFELEHLDHPLVPDFTVVCFAVHGDDEFTVVRDIERGLYKGGKKYISI